MTDQLVKDNERIDDLQNGYYVCLLYTSPSPRDTR